MRQLNNKHFDTKEGASALPGKLSHPQLAPSVSQKDEIMNQDQKDLILELTRKERARLFNLKRDKAIYNSVDYFRVKKEIDLCTSIVDQLKGGK